MAAKKAEKKTPRFVGQAEFLKIFRHLEARKDWVKNNTINEITKHCEKEFNREFSRFSIKNILDTGELEYKKGGGGNKTGGVIAVVNKKVEELKTQVELQDEQTQSQLAQMQKEVSELKAEVSRLQNIKNKSNSKPLANFSR